MSNLIARFSSISLRGAMKTGSRASGRICAGAPFFRKYIELKKDRVAMEITALARSFNSPRLLVSILNTPS
jgi:hypothetical protein